MECLHCGYHNTKVDESASSTDSVYRSRKCEKCAKRFKTVEIPRGLNTLTDPEKVLLVVADDAGVPTKSMAKWMKRLWKEIKEAKEEMLDSGEYFEILDKYEDEKTN